MSLILAVLLVLSPLLVHEAGHWAVLRRFNVPTVQFWLGLGPMIFRWRRLRVGMLPIGGAVVPEETAYRRLAPLQRVMVALAGPAASVLYGVVLLAIAKLNIDIEGFKGLELLGMLNLWLAFINLVPVPPLDGFQAWASWREHKNTPFSPRVLGFAHRIGSGVVYGAGFFILATVFFG